MPSAGMQYAQRKLQRSVIEIRRSLTRRSNGSMRGIGTGRVVTAPRLGRSPNRWGPADSEEVAPRARQSAELLVSATLRGGAGRWRARLGRTLGQVTGPTGEPPPAPIPATDRAGAPRPVAGLDPVAVGDQGQAVGRGHAGEHVARLEPGPLADVVAVLERRRRTRSRWSLPSGRRPNAVRAVARTIGLRSQSVRPIILRNAGRANSSKLTRDETGIAGQPEHRRAASERAERERLGRLDRDLRPREPAAGPLRGEPFEHDLHVVEVAHRHRAARQERVALARPRQ